MRKRFDRYAFVRAWRVSVDERPDPRDTTLLCLYKGEGLAGVEGARRWRYYIVTYGIERRKFSSIKTRLITAFPATSVSSRHDPARLDEGGETKRTREPLCCADRSNNATTRVRHSRPADLRSGRAIIRDFLPAINVRHVGGGGSEFNLTAFITRYRA